MSKSFFPAGTRAYSYIRFSSAPQERGDSLRRQTELSVNYAKEHGLILDETLHLRDLGVSAFDGSNVEKGALGEFVRYARAGRIPSGSVLLVESLDRLSRADPMDAFRLFQEILSQGITIITLADSQVFDPREMRGDNAIMPMLKSIVVMARAHDESARKSQRGRAAWKSKRENAGSKKLTETCPQWMRLSDDRSKFEFVDENVRVVRRIIEMQMHGMGQQAIAKRLNEEGVPLINYRSRAGKGWHPSTIQKICTSPALYGAFQSTAAAEGGARKPAGEPTANYFPALLTRGEFHALQQARVERRSRGRGAKGETFTNLFQGLLRCGYCGGTMVVAGHKPKSAPRTKRFIACSNAKLGIGGCRFIMWGMKDFERTIMSYVTGIDFSALIGGENSLSRQIALVERELAELEVALAECTSRERNFVEAIAAGGNFASIRAALSQAEQDKEDVATEIDRKGLEMVRLKTLLSDASSIKDSVLGLYEKMGKITGNDLYELRANLAAQIRRAVRQIRVYPGGRFLAEHAQDDDWIGSHFYAGGQLPPVRSLRCAEIIGNNGCSMFTSTVLHAIARGDRAHAETLAALGQEAEQEIALEAEDDRIAGLKRKQIFGGVDMISCPAVRLNLRKMSPHEWGANKDAMLGG